MSTTELIQLSALKRNLSFLLLGQKGGANRIKIIELLRSRPYNINQIADKLDLNYRTVKHHIDLMIKYEVISSSKTGGYGDVFFLSPELDGNIKLYETIIQKLDTTKQLKNFTDSPRFFKNIIQQTYEAVIIVDREWDVFFWNRAASRIFGYRAEEIILGPLDIFRDEHTFDALKKKLTRTKHLEDFETLGKTRTGEPIDLNITISPVLDDDKNMLGYSVLARDITKRKQLERSMKESEAKYRGAFNSSLDLLYRVGPDGIILEVNDTVIRVLGYEREELVGRPILELYSEDSARKTKRALSKWTKKSELRDKPVTVLAKNGRPIPVILNVIAVCDDTGKIHSSLCSQRMVE